jgi:hypothetical protein
MNLLSAPQSMWLMQMICVLVGVAINIANATGKAFAIKRKLEDSRIKLFKIAVNK